MKKLFLKNYILLLVLLIVSTSNFCLAQNALSPQISPNESTIETEKPQKIPQDKALDEINPFSLRPIPKSHIAFQKSIWLQVSFNQKANLPLWYAGHELSKFLIENALNGKITAYRDDKLEAVLSKEDLLESLKVEDNFNDTIDFENKTSFDIKTDSINSLPKLIDFSELSLLEIKEDYILDIQHSRMIHDVIAFTLIIPANKDRFRQKIVSFSYKEIIEKLFRPLKEDYVIIETTKSNGHIPNLETLIDARFFHGYIVKYDNFKNEYFEDQYDTKREAILKSMQYEEKLIEFEGFLWE